MLFSRRSQPTHPQLLCLSLTSAGGRHLSQHKCVHSSRRLCYWQTLAGITARVTTGTDTLTQGFSHESFRVNKGGGDTEMTAFCIVRSEHRNRHQPTNCDVSTQWMLFSNKKKHLTTWMNLQKACEVEAARPRRVNATWSQPHHTPEQIHVICSYREQVSAGETFWNG